MLDANLPTFYLKPSPDNVKHHQAYYFTQYGSEPEPTYSLRHPDPSSPSARNCYAAGLFDCHNPEVLYGEVLIKPAWTQPTLSQEEIRKNGGIPPPPQPIMPSEFTIQLYNPDQQVVVSQKVSSWSGTQSYEFSMPQDTFRRPSGSALDRSQSDPVADATTPKINFVWRKEGKLTKDLTCFLTGKSTDPAGRKKHKEPDIAIALFSGLKEVTIYESNMYRVEMEDPKGLEVVMLLGAAVIRDLYLGQMKDVFNTGEASRKNSGGILGGRKYSSPSNPTAVLPSLVTDAPQPVPHSPPQPPRPLLAGAAINGLYNTPPQTRNDHPRPSLPPLQTRPAQPAPPPTDPLTQWQIGAETARLKAAAEKEERDRRRAEESRRREREKADEAAARRLQKQLDAEEKEKRRRAAEVERETERLRRKYGDQQGLVPTLPQRHTAPIAQGPFQRPQGPLPPQGFPPRHGSAPQVAQQRPGGGPYLQPPGVGGSASTSGFFNNSGGAAQQPGSGQRLKGGKKSLWGLRSLSEGGSSGKLTKKQSSLF